MGFDNDFFTTIDSFKDYIAKKRELKTPSIFIHLIPQKPMPQHPVSGIPQLHFDQLVIMAHQHHAARTNSEPWSQTLTSPPIADTNRPKFQQKVTKIKKKKSAVEYKTLVYIGS